MASQLPAGVAKLASRERLEARLGQSVCPNVHTPLFQAIEHNRREQDASLNCMCPPTFGIIM